MGLAGTIYEFQRPAACQQKKVPYHFYYPYLATGATLGKEQETKVRWKKILRVIAKKKLLFLRSTPQG
jgi:hypothetical protein